MKQKYMFSANAFKIIPRRLPSLLLLLAGCSVFLTGLLMLLRIIPSVYLLTHSLLGSGMLLLVAGLLLLPKKTGMTITINSSRGIIVFQDHYFFKKIRTAFPLSHFTKITVRERLYKTSREDIQRTYEIILTTVNNTDLLLGEFPGKTEAFHFVENLRQRILLDVYFRNKIYKKTDFNPKTGHAPETIQLSPLTKINKIQDESSINLRWKKRHSHLHWPALAGMLYTLFHTTHFVIIPEQGFNLAPITGYLLFMVLGIFILLFFLVKWQQSYSLQLAQESLKYSYTFAGIKIHQASMHWDNLALIKNTINMSSLMIISDNGCEIIEEYLERLQQAEFFPADEDLLAKLTGLAGEQITLDVQNLPVSDRIRIEQEILKFML